MTNVALTAKLADFPPGTTGLRTIDLPGWTLFLDIDLADTLGVRLHSLKMVPGLGEKLFPPATIHQAAECLSRQATGLLEPLCLLEMDTTRPEALLRSTQPAQRAERERHYYEVRLSGDGCCNLHRYAGLRHEDHRRDAIAFTLTHDALAKFVTDVQTSLPV
jgi:hypothetical protein